MTWWLSSAWTIITPTTARDARPIPRPKKRRCTLWVVPNYTILSPIIPIIHIIPKYTILLSFTIIPYINPLIIPNWWIDNFFCYWFSKDCGVLKLHEPPKLFLSSSYLLRYTVHHTLNFVDLPVKESMKLTTCNLGRLSCFITWWNMFRITTLVLASNYIEKNNIKKNSWLEFGLIFFWFAHPDYSKLMYQSAGVGASFMSYGHDHRQVIFIDWDTRIWKSAPWVAGKSPYTGDISS